MLAHSQCTSCLRYQSKTNENDNRNNKSSCEIKHKRSRKEHRHCEAASSWTLSSWGCVLFVFSVRCCSFGCCGERKSCGRWLLTQTTNSLFALRSHNSPLGDDPKANVYHSLYFRTDLHFYAARMHSHPTNTTGQNCSLTLKLWSN